MAYTASEPGIGSIQICCGARGSQACGYALFQGMKPSLSYKIADDLATTHPRATGGRSRITCPSPARPVASRQTMVVVRIQQSPLRAPRRARVLCRAQGEGEPHGDAAAGRRRALRLLRSRQPSPGCRLVTQARAQSRSYCCKSQRANNGG